MRTIRIPKLTRDQDGKPLCRWCKTPVPPPRRTFCSNECVHEARLRSDPGYLRDETHKRDKGICAACGHDTDKTRKQIDQLWLISQNGVRAYKAIGKKASKRTGTPEDRMWDLWNRPTVEDIEAQIQQERESAQRHWEYQKRHAELHGLPFSRPAPDDCPHRAAREKDLRSRAIRVTPEDQRLIQLDTRLRRLAEARRKRLLDELAAAGFTGATGYRRNKVRNLWQADHIKPVAEGGGACDLDNIQTLCTPCHKRKTAEQARRAALARRGIDPNAPDPQTTLPL